MNDDNERNYSRTNTKLREKRRKQATKKWREQPVEQFLEYKKGEIVSEQYNKLERLINQFNDYLSDEVSKQTGTDIQDVRDAVEDDLRSFRDTVLKPDPNLKNSTIADKLSHISHLYNILEQENAIAGNPVTIPLKEFRENHDLESRRPHIPFSRMKHFLNWLTRPFSRAFWLCGFKHGTRTGEVINLDLRCLHIDHPIFWKIVDEHNIKLDPRVRDKPDTIVIYEQFNQGTEIPNTDTPGPETQGEVREEGNKRKEEGGSILPLDSELKTALIEWLLVRPPTHNQTTHPLFTINTNPQRPVSITVRSQLWSEDYNIDSIQHFAEEERLETCPTCDEGLVEENPAKSDKPGRRFRCRRCHTNYWRSVFWDSGLATAQKMTFHQARHYFSNAHSPTKTELHDGSIPDRIRKKRFRGDADSDGDTEDQTYMQKKYEDYENDIREPYLKGIYRFDIYDNPIPAVGEGWDK